MYRIIIFLIYYNVIIYEIGTCYFFKSLKSSMIESVLIITSMSLLMNNIITYNKQALRSQVFNI